MSLLSCRNPQTYGNCCLHIVTTFYILSLLIFTYYCLKKKSDLSTYCYNFLHIITFYMLFTRYNIFIVLTEGGRRGGHLKGLRRPRIKAVQDSRRKVQKNATAKIANPALCTVPIRLHFTSILVSVQCFYVCWSFFFFGEEKAIFCHKPWFHVHAL